MEPYPPPLLLPAIAPEDSWEETYPDHVSGAAVGTAGYGIVQFSYDPAGRIRMKTDQQGDTCTFTYNLAGQLLSRAYRTAANSPSGTVADSDTFTYDRAGRMLTALSGRYANTVTLAYDHAGRLSSEGLTIAGQTYSVGRTYDVRGLEATLSYPGGSVVQRSYTPRRQLQQTSYLGAVVESRTYDAAGRHATSTSGNAAVTTNSYRLDNLLASRATSHAGSEQLGTYSYSWDANKNKTAETIGAQGSGFGFSVPAGGYDQEDRLTAWNRTDGARNQSWTLSAVGDWTAHSDAGVSQTRTHAAAHELTALTTGGTTSPLSYDPKGNLLSRPAALASPALGLVWDFDNRLRGADTNGTPATQEVTFEYDALGRRVARSEAGNNVVYVHAGQQVIADYARGAAAAAPSFRYVYGSYVDEPLLRHAGTGTTLPTSGTGALYYHRNQQYSIVGLSDAAGTLVERYAYTAYGELTILAPDRTARATSSFQNRYTYTGREWDPTLRLYYFRARWLEPKAGRFLGRDPLGYVDGMGLYGAYFGLEKSDPSGSWAFPCSCDCVHEGGLCSHKEGHVEANDYLTALSKCDAKCRRYSSSPGETCTPFYCSGSLRGTGGENGGVLCAYLVHLCDQYQDPEERKECKEEAKNICMCIAKAYDKMMEAGGPVRFRKNQNDTEAWVCEKCSNNITTQCELDGISQKYFFLFHRSAAFGIRRPWDYLTQFWMGYGHQWNNITFTGPNGKYEYITIDMWSNPTDWWNPGLDSCGSVDNMSGDLPNLPHLHRKRKN